MLWCVNCSLTDVDRKKLSVTNLSWSQLAAALPFLKTSYLVIFRSGMHYAGHADTIMQYL